MYHSAHISHPGKQRSSNQDAYLAQDSGLWLVADGMGGHSGGEVASSGAIESITNALAKNGKLAQAIVTAQHDLLAKARQNTALADMGTTLVAAQRQGRHLQLAWVGDSRIYHYQDGILSQLSRDHTFVQDMIDRGVLTPEQAATHPQAHLLRRALGPGVGERFYVDTGHCRLTPGGRLLLCSDGVHGVLTHEVLQRCMAQTTLDDCINALKEQVLLTDAPDNFTAVVIEKQPAEGVAAKLKRLLF